MFAKLQSTRLRRDKVLAGLTSVLSVFSMSLLLFIQDSTASTRVWMPVCSEQNSSGDALCEYQLSIIGIPVKVATESRYYIRRMLGIQLEWDKPETEHWGYSVDKGAWSEHNTINNKRLSITEVRCKNIQEQRLGLQRSPLTFSEVWNDRACRTLRWGITEQLKRQSFHLSSLTNNKEH